MAEYKVRSGDTGYSIARTKGIPFKSLQAANRGKNLNKLAIGQMLTIPAEKATKPKQSVIKKKTAQSKTSETVQKLTTKSNLFAAKTTDSKTENTNYTTTQIKDKIKAEAKKQGVDENLALAVVEQESQFKPSAKSHTGALGLFQLTKIAAKQVNGEKTCDVDKNIETGTKYLKWCLDHTKTNEEALVAYNRGLTAMKKAKNNGTPIDSITDKKDGKGYAENVLNILEKNKNI